MMADGISYVLRALALARSQGPEWTSWRALHVVGEGDHDDTLCNAILPVVHEQLCEGVLDGAFFVRYWEDGRHIRLRLGFENSGGACYVNALARGVHELLAQRIAGTHYRIEDRAYVRELDRYGGAQRIPLCEVHFMLSSLCVMTRLRGMRGMPAPLALSRTRLPAAAREMMAMVTCAYRRAKDAINFLEAYGTMWLMPRTSNRAQKSSQYRAMSTLMHRHVMERLDDALVCDLTSWRAGAEVLAGGPVPAGGEAAMSDAAWRHANDEIFGALSNDGRFFCRTEGGRALAGMIHMNNNRYGIVNWDEAYLAALCAAALQETL